jgi:hypothetical protein
MAVQTFQLRHNVTQYVVRDSKLVVVAGGVWKAIVHTGLRGSKFSYKPLACLMWFRLNKAVFRGQGISLRPCLFFMHMASRAVR